jgi:uncharacterized Ntn-hydrolase superfamily protein
MGAAVQSHWFSVGSLVTWARPGAGAVVTQSVADPGYGPRLLSALEGGTAAADALGALLGADGSAEYRQIAAIGPTGPPEAHTGASCIAFAGHATGEHFSAQANIMASDQVWPAMARAFETSNGPLSRRLLAAMRGAESAGGDVRGKQSAAMVVVPARGEAWETVVDLRVEDHPEPLDELERLLGLADAYALAGQGDDLTAEGRHGEAGERYRQAAELAPGNHELLFWAGLSAFHNGDNDAGLAAVRRAIELQPGWAELLGRLPPEIAPAAAAVSEALSQPGR